MKKFITNNWEKILIFIGIICILINISLKLSTEKTLLNDYIKYGKDVQSGTVSSGNIIGNISETVTDGSLVSESPFTPEITKIIILIIAAVLFAAFVSTLGDRAAAKAKAKKK